MTFVDLFWLSIALAYTIYSISGVSRRSDTISVDFSLFVLLNDTKFMNKFKFDEFFKNQKQK